MSKKIVVELEGEGVVIEPESGHMFSLNETGMFVFRLLEKGRSEKEIARRLCKEYDVSGKQSLSDVIEFARQLVEKGYIERRNSSCSGRGRKNTPPLK